MAKKKMASPKVAKKKDLKKSKTKKVKKEKGGVKAGRKLVLVAGRVFAPKGSLLSKVVKAFDAADDKIMGENELVVAMEKAGVKAEGKKTVKKLVKGILRNMLRAGVVAKQRDIKNNAELKEFIGGAEDESDEEDGDEDESESEDESEEDADGEEEGEEDADEEDGGDDEEEKPKKATKKKVVKGKKAKK